MGNKWTDGREAVAENRVVTLSDWVQIDYLDTTQKLICWLPVGAIVLDVLINVTEAFDDTSTDYIEVGTTDDDDIYAEDVDVSSIAMKAESQNTTPVIPGIRLTSETAIYAIYKGANGDAAAGIAQVSVLWVPSARKELDT